MTENQEEKYFLLTVGCLDENIEKMFQLIKEIINAPDFTDFSNLKNQINQMGTAISDSIQNDPLGLAVNYG